MSLEDNILDVSQLRFTGDFDNQVDYLLLRIRLTRNEVESLSVLFNDLEYNLQKAWPGCQVHPFGSIVTGLGIRTSDVDCYVSLPEWAKEQQGGRIVMKAKWVLNSASTIFTELFAIPSAKVPIVKFYHVPNARHCDVSFRSPSGVRNSKLLAYLLHTDRRALPLAVLIKYWSKVHKLTGTNLIPNYALSLLVVFYLQQIDILPPVCELQKNVPEYMVDKWNTAFDQLNYISDNDDSLYSILGNFFQYYNNFDFDKYVVCPYLGYAVEKSKFKTLKDVPSEFELYKKNVRCQEYRPLKTATPICIQDPFEHCRNCSVAVYPKLFQQLITHFKDVSKSFSDTNNDSFLKSMLTRRIDDSPPKKPNQAPNKVMKPKQQQFNKIKKNIRQNFNTLYGEYSKLRKGKR